MENQHVLIKGVYTSLLTNNTFTLYRVPSNSYLHAEHFAVTSTTSLLDVVYVRANVEGQSIPLLYLDIATYYIGFNSPRGLVLPPSTEVYLVLGNTGGEGTVTFVMFGWLEPYVGN